MKKSILILGCMIGSFALSAGVNAQNAVFNVAKASRVIAVAPTKMAVLYIGVDNPVEIAISDIPTKYVTATVDSGKIENLGEGKFNVKVTSRLSTTKINVYATYNGVKTKVGEKLFRVKRVPDPSANIAGASSGVLSKDQLTAANGIIPVMKDFDFDLSFTITSFTMTANQGGDLVEYKGTGNHFTSQMISLIQRVPKGSKVYFEDIVAVGPDGVSRTLNSINFKII